MAELINKWDVVSKLIDLENEFQHYKPFNGFEHAMYRKVCETEVAIGKTQGVEIVRCKDCRWYAPNNDGYWLGCTFKTDNPEDEPKPDDFCSYGERKDND